MVNALLTHIDQLKARENVLILTTSNISEAIDLAFVDRADIKQYIGPPILSARFAILRSCVSELMRVGIVAPPVHLLGFDAAQKAAAELSRSPSHLAACEGGSGAGAGGMIGNGSGDAMASARGGGSSGGGSKELRHLEQCPSAMLLRAAALTDGFSGRTLRKLPLQAHATFVQRPSASLPVFLAALVRAAQHERAARKDMEQHK